MRGSIHVYRHLMRRNVAVKMDLELLRARHPNACMNCDVNGRCEFQNLMYKYDIKQDPWGKMPRYG
jgi:NADH-quinone oxidoreductase subunit G